MKWGRKGQITIFLIIGIVILAIFAGVFYLVSYFQKEQLTAEERIPESLSISPRIKFFVESCLQEAAIPGIYLLGTQGGFIYPDDISQVLITEKSIINYGYLNGINQLSTAKMEEDIADYVEESINFCLDNFSVFQQEVIVVEEKGQPQTSAKIKNGEIQLTLKYPLQVKSADDSIEIEDFYSTVSLDLARTVSQANKIIEKNEPGLDLDYLTSFDAFVSVFPFDEETTIYSLSDEKSVYNGAPFTFIFAVQDFSLNTPPRLDFIPDVVLENGGNFTYELNAEDDEDDALVFSSNSADFPVSEEGLLNVSAVKTGLYSVTFSVKDTSGLKDEQTIRIVVEE
ncbi:MAG: hypothetical protein ABIA37_03170 [Candidatus Woesearchaeota archaeon]